MIVHRTISVPRNGFTLVEMLVALTIFALLAAGGTGLLRASLDTQTAVDARLAELGDIGRLHALLSSDLGQAVSRVTRAPDGVRPSFVGNSSGMQFVAAGWTNLDGSARSELRRVAWKVSNGDFSRVGNPQLDGSDEGAMAASLARDLTSASLRYRKRDGSWSPTFDSNEQEPLPAAVELTLTKARSAPLIFVFALPEGAVPPPKEPAA